MRLLGRWAQGWSPIVSVLRGHGREIVSLAFASFAGALMEAGFLVLLTATILALANGQATLDPAASATITIPAALAISLGALVIRLGVSLLGVSMTARISAKVTTEQRDHLARAFINAPWAVQHAEPSGRLQELLSSFAWRATQTAQVFTQGVTAVLSLVAFLGTGFFVDPILTAGVLAALALFGAVLTPLRRRIRRISADATTANLSFAGSVAELGTLGQEMHVFGAQPPFVRRLDDLSGAAVEHGRRLQFSQGLLTPVYTSLAYGAVLSGIAILWAIGASNLAAVGAVMLLMVRSLSYAQQLLTVSGQLAANIPSLERLATARAEYAITPSVGGQQIPEAVAPIEFDSVGFSYEIDRAALRNVTATFHAGELVGVIGPSGAGKSTMAQLLLGLRSPTAGRILVSGVDRQDVDQVWWTRRVAFVPQEPRLLTGTVAENLRFFREGLTTEDLRNAAQQANVLADIEALPQGFDTHLGERGSGLSGGQRQRLSIARALAGSPELLVLDEPTSALDGRSEALIRDTLADLRSRVTVVLIAHRMSTLDLCDKILVVEGGVATAFGAPSDLLSSSPYYRRALEAAGMASSTERAG